VAGSAPIPRRPQRRAALAVVGLLILAALVLWGWGGLAAGAAGWARWQAERVLDRYGLPALAAYLYLEETGITMPIPGDLPLLAYAHGAALDARWAGIWALLTLVTALGAINLYWIFRVGGRRLLGTPGARWVGLTEPRVSRAERWFGRWGAWVVVAGRFVPGGRIAVTAVAGLLAIPFPAFALSVTASAGLWVLSLLVLGRILAGDVASFAIRVHRGPATALLLGLGSGVLAVLVWRLAKKKAPAGKRPPERSILRVRPWEPAPQPVAGRRTPRSGGRRRPRR